MDTCDRHLGAIAMRVSCNLWVCPMCRAPVHPARLTRDRRRVYTRLLRLWGPTASEQPSLPTTPDCFYSGISQGVNDHSTWSVLPATDLTLTKGIKITNARVQYLSSWHHSLSFLCALSLFSQIRVQGTWGSWRLWGTSIWVGPRISQMLGFNTWHCWHHSQDLHCLGAIESQMKVWATLGLW